MKITYAQKSVYNLYFLENVPQRSILNPAQQPTSGFYLSLPVIGYTQADFGTTDLSASLLSKDVTTIFNALSTTSMLESSSNINLLAFGYRKNANYYKFGVNMRSIVSIGLPKDLFRLALFGVNSSDYLSGNVNDSVFNLGSFSQNAQSFVEVSLGYSRKINDKLSFGGNLKYLHGLANVQTEFDNFDIHTGVNRWMINANAVMRTTLPGNTYVGNTINSIEFNMPSAAMDYIKPQGVGFGVDLGATYRMLDFLELGLAVTDLGFISWSKNVNDIHIAADYDFESLNNTGGSGVFDGVDMKALFDSLNNNVDQHITVNNRTKRRISGIGPKINASAELGFLKNKLSVGLLSSTAFYDKRVYENFVTSFNIKPVNWFNMALSYGITNWKSSSFGAGMGVRVGMFNFFLSSDFIPTSYEKYKLDNPIELGTGRTIRNVTLPDKAKQFNFAVGMNIVFGNKRDNDKDGVRDSKDKCPDTPFGVIVDRKGCPLDTDKDSIPDYLDKCPDTPVEAHKFIDGDGCPLDTDGDGVFDYIDKCPDTPQEAIGKIDSVGCPLDTDIDGVPDYLDKCPGSVPGATVDSVGCALDTDKDGVADHIDKCPDTPKEAYGMVDVFGCPLDSDKDGVPDYLDKCPNTVPEAVSTVDSVGCPLDSDADGVSDYHDKCPGTPAEAIAKVDSVGCPVDSDGDGVYDYLDRCPTIPGVASNGGCPEIKKEVRMLFQKALQGIQFETGKSVIKPASFGILNQVAASLKENPTYLVEVQGHTDNVGKKESNMKLSVDRATAVRKYLIQKGVAEGRITSNGYGDTMPVVPNTTAQNKAKNRRVQFVVSFEEIKTEN